MIVEYRAVQISARLDPRADSRRRAPHRRAMAGNKELIRKHYIAGENGNGGAFYIWPSKEAAQRGHDAEWRANIEKRTGSTPTIRYFDLLMIVDNEAGSVTEFPPNVSARRRNRRRRQPPRRRQDRLIQAIMAVTGGANPVEPVADLARSISGRGLPRRRRPWSAASASFPA